MISKKRLKSKAKPVDSSHTRNFRKNLLIKVYKKPVSLSFTIVCYFTETRRNCFTAVNLCKLHFFSSSYSSVSFRNESSSDLSKIKHRFQTAKLKCFIRHPPTTSVKKAQNIATLSEVLSSTRKSL